MPAFDVQIAEIFKGLSNVVLFQNPVLNSILVSIIIILSSLIIARIFLFFTEKVVERLTRKTKTKIDDLIVEKTKKPFYLLMIFFGLRISLIPLFIPQIIETILIEIIYSVIIIILFFIIGRSFNVVIDEWGKEFAKKTKSNTDDQLISLFHKFVNAFFIIMAIIFVLQAWGIKVTPFLASLGIAGIAIGFALQNTIANIFGGVQLIIDKTMEVNDVIKVGNDIFGTVEDIGIRSTRIKTFDNEMLIVPNGFLANQTIQNFAQPEEKVRVLIDFGVDYSSDPKKVKKIVVDVLKKTKSILKNPEPNILFIDMADFSLKFRAVFWVSSYKDRINIKSEAVGEIYNALKKNKITIPYPTRTVIMKKE